MSGTEENMPAMNGPAAPFTFKRNPGWKSPRFLLFSALAAAIFVYDSFLYDSINSRPPAPTPVFRNMSSSYIQASSSFQSLISTIFWIGGAGLVLSGCFKLREAWRHRKKDPALVPHREKTLLYLLLSISLMAYPLVHEAFSPQGTIYYNAYHLAYYAPPAETGAGAGLKTFALYNWCFGAIAFFFGGFALERAHRLKDAPEAQVQKDKAAFRFMAGFIMTALPFACASFMGVELW